MPFKKLIEPLKEAIIQRQFESPLPFQKKILSKIKGGANIFGIGPEGCGKTTTLILSVVQKLKGLAFEDAPRALIVVKDKQAALSLASEFNRFTSQTDLRVYCAYEEHSIDVSQLQLFIVEDAEFAALSNNFQDINRISESIDKCQYLVFGKSFDRKIKRFQNSFMHNSQVIEIK